MKLTIRAIPHARCANKPRTLTNRKRTTAHILRRQILHVHIRRKPQATAATIRRHAIAVIRPRLDVERVERVFKVHVLGVDVLDGFEFVFVLPDRADGYAETVVKVRVEEGYVCAVCFAGERVVAVVDG